MRKTSILFIGLGGIGAPIASKLISRSDLSLSFISKSIAVVGSTRAITIEQADKKQLFEIAANAPLNEKDTAADIIILSCKTHQNRDIYPSVVSYSDKNTLLLVLQNGIGISRELARHNFPGVTFDSVVVSSSHQVSTDVISVQKNPELFLSVEYQHHVKQFSLLKDIFDNSEVSYHLCQASAEELMWRKFAFVICISSATVKFPGPCSMIIEHSLCLNFFKSLCREFTIFAASRKIYFDVDELIEDGLSRVRNMPVKNYSSMTLDALEYKYGELEFFLEDMLLNEQGEFPGFKSIANLLSQVRRQRQKSATATLSQLR
ncbi:MAG TPA: ketopantoate reductase [Serratia liquefaciens]|nr:ketopantoate reductase [Serratia liquefaciens]